MVEPKIFVMPNNWSWDDVNQFAEQLRGGDSSMLLWMLRGETDEDPYLIKVKDVTIEELKELLDANKNGRKTY